MNKQKALSLAVFIIGLVMCAVGVVFLVLNLTKSARIQDGEYLVSAENWVLIDDSNCASEVENCTSGVIWDFTEIGKGTLTTNDHLNDYDFLWAIEDGKLLIETDWLYDLENSYDYTLDQGSGTLTLRDDAGEYKFIANFPTE